MYKGTCQRPSQSPWLHSSFQDHTSNGCICHLIPFCSLIKNKTDDGMVLKELTAGKVSRLELSWTSYLSKLLYMTQNQYHTHTRLDPLFFFCIFNVKSHSNIQLIEKQFCRMLILRFFFWMFIMIKFFYYRIPRK